MRNKTDDLSQFCVSGNNQNNSSQQRSENKAVIAVMGDDIKDNDDKGARRSADLHARAAKKGNEEARYNGGDQSFIRRGTAGYAESHGEGKRDDGNNESRQRIGSQIREA